MLDDPARVDAHVVGHHVAGQPDAACPGPVAEVRVGGLAAEVVRDAVVVEGVGADATASALPRIRLIRSEATERCHSPMSHRPVTPQRGEPVELLVGDRVERPDRRARAARQLVEPDVRALGHQHELRHPGRVAREGLRLVAGPRTKARWLRRARRGPVAAAEALVEAAFLLEQDADGQVEPTDEGVELARRGGAAQCSRT